MRFQREGREIPLGVSAAVYADPVAADAVVAAHGDDGRGDGAA